MDSNDLVVAAFGVASVLRIAAYWPQFRAVWRDRTGACAISCCTWNLWCACHLVTALYTWTQTHDLALTLVLIANALCCAAVTVLTLVRRAALRKQRSAPSASSSFIVRSPS
jgi:hypothetical protein